MRWRPKDPNTGERGALAVDLEGLVYTIGVVGVNEMVQHHTGKQLHESKEAFRLAIRAMTEMELYGRELSKKNNMTIALARTPAGTTGQRFAVADLLDRRYHNSAVKVIKGDIEEGLEMLGKTRDLPVYYTNGTQSHHVRMFRLQNGWRSSMCFSPLWMVEISSISGLVKHVLTPVDL